MDSFEKLGAFYLGRRYDAAKQEVTDETVLYDAKDLTTHAVCVGMTGSGKTGLCLSLLEEAAIDGIPAIAIDPKGDLGNLALTFPKLRPADFRPWVDEAEAARKGKTPDEYAADRAALWKKGLGKWGQDGSRIARFKDAVDLSIYTPGSNAGLPLRVLRSFTAPPQAVLDDSDAFRQQVTTAVSGLLALLGIDADPLQSREHILLATILQRAWKEGLDLDVADLIRKVQAPEIDRIGVLDLESFFPSKDRGALAMRLNNLLASPGFSSWMEGDPLDVQRLLWTPDGKPKISILSISHLNDAERMFFVTVLLNEVVAWMRTQSGTSSLRALLYMDEVFGYFPPVATPPSKAPMLTLLKQARAYGLGVVLSTQNPADLDYKGLSNTGTWFLGRLQTERDKARVLEGLEGASASAGNAFDRQETEKTLAGLKSRVFLMNNVHEDAPALFHTRWVLSYLRGPLTRNQIRLLTHGEKKTAKSGVTPPPPGKRTKPKAAPAAVKRPMVPAGTPEKFITRTGALGKGEKLLYRPALFGIASVHFTNARAKVDHWEEIFTTANLTSRTGANVWNTAALRVGKPPVMDGEAESDAGFGPLPAAASSAKSYTVWKRGLGGHLYKERVLALWKCAELKLISEAGETEGDFRTRLQQAAREKRDLQVEKLRKKYTPKLARLEDRIRKTEQRIGKEAAQYGQQKMQTAISVGATLLGALFGRKVASVGNVGRASTAMRGVGRASREKQDIARAKEDLAAQQKMLADLEQEFEAETGAVGADLDISALTVQQVNVRLRKGDTIVESVGLVWMPWRVGPDGIAEPLYQE
ncbi:MAG: ATP-binding protein [Acidobacteria bacterium]|uniref:ATP-binding protein n=1 Tax=Candidatus Polarisedimenticola svalbardensis TaxID=2886004 RepID=A0A8J7CD06_9BACT|nr:ATP-binding protein [Candidatus Polarisedimenticola svalbardensis]